MRENNEMAFYSFIEEFAKRFTYGSEAGLEIDISVFLQGMKEIQRIKEFTVSFDRMAHCYKISVINLEDVDILNIHPIFLQFQGYVAFSSGGTMYARKEISNGIRYLLILLWKDRTGYCCELDFIGPQ